MFRAVARIWLAALPPCASVVNLFFLLKPVTRLH